MAPERVRGERATTASDRYALAVVAYELLAGRRSFERQTPSTEALAHDPVPAIRAQRPELPAELDRVLARSLAKDALGSLPEPPPCASQARRGCN